MSVVRGVRDALSIPIIVMSHMLAYRRLKGEETASLVVKCMPWFTMYLFADAFALTWLDNSLYKASMLVHHMTSAPMFAIMTGYAHRGHSLMTNPVLPTHIGDLIITELCSVWLTFLKYAHATSAYSCIRTINIVVYFLTRIVMWPFSIKTMWENEVQLTKYPNLKLSFASGQTLSVLLNVCWFKKLLEK